MTQEFIMLSSAVAVCFCDKSTDGEKLFERNSFTTNLRLEKRFLFKKSNLLRDSAY